MLYSGSRTDKDKQLTPSQPHNTNQELLFQHLFHWPVRMIPWIFEIHQRELLESKNKRKISSNFLANHSWSAFSLDIFIYTVLKISCRKTLYIPQGNCLLRKGNTITEQKTIIKRGEQIGQLSNLKRHKIWSGLFLPYSMSRYEFVNCMQRI